jgi:ribonuclease HI
MTIRAYIDGASRGNPGESGIGILYKDENGKILLTVSAYIGNATNNIAEYTALLTCLKKASQFNCRKLIINSDSELLARQMNGLYKIKNTGIKNIYQKVLQVLSNSNFQVEINHVARELNQAADLLANEGIDNKKKIKDI